MLRPVMPVYVQSFSTAKTCTFVPPFPESEFSDVTSVGDHFTMSEAPNLAAAVRRPNVERVSLDVLRDQGLGAVIDQFPKLVTFLNQDLNPAEAYLATSKFGKDRATYILECGGKKLVLDTRGAHLTANFNAMSSLLLRQPKVAVGDGCALWTFVKGVHQQPGEMVDLMMDGSREGTHFLKDIVRSLMFYNLWRDRHAGNYIVSQRGHLSLIDFYSKGSHDDERFFQAFSAKNIASEIQYFVNDLLWLIIRDKVYGPHVHEPISDEEFEALLRGVSSAIDGVLSDTLFLQTMNNLVSTLDWGNYPIDTVHSYYDADFSALSGNELIGYALLEQARKISVRSPIGSFFFSLSRKF